MPFVLAVLLACPMVAQESANAIKPVIENRLSKPYPDGVYKTTFDFVRKVPTNQYPIAAKSIVGLNYEDLKGSPEQCFFFYKFGENPKITDAFAVCYNGNIYFRINAILDNKSKRGRSEAAQFPNSFVRVSVQTPKFMYTDVNFSNAWSVGVAANARGADMHRSARNMAVVWDSEKKLFHILKFCEDFNEFIAPFRPELVQQCAKNQAADPGIVRSAIETMIPVTTE